MTGPVAPEAPADVAALDDLLGRAGKAFLSRDYDGSRSLLEEARAVAPNSPDVVSMLVRIATREEAWPEVVARVDELAGLTTPGIEFLQYRARALSQLGHWTAAAAAWSEVSALRPASLDALQDLATAQINARELLQATGSLRKMRLTAGRDGPALAWAGRAATAAGAYPLSIEIHQDLAALDPGLLGALYQEHVETGDMRGLAVLLAASQGDSSEPLPEATSAVAALFRGAVHRERSNDRIGALLDYTAASLLAETDPLVSGGVRRLRTALLAEVDARIEAGETSAARAICLQLLCVEPALVEATRRLARIEALGGDPAEAHRLWRDVMARQTDREALTGAARAAEQAGLYAEALALWGRLATFSPGDRTAARELERLPQRMLSAGRASMVEGRELEAWRILSAIPPAAPAHEDAQRRLTQVGRRLIKTMREAYREGRFDEVVALGEAAASIEPGNADVHRLVARSAAKQRRFGDAAAAWSALARQDTPESGQAWVQAARCFVLSGDRGPAKAALDRARALDPDPAEFARVEADVLSLADDS
jgi:tetratricopeptide (TPR) repeat protein